MPYHLFSKDTGISLKRNIILVHVSADPLMRMKNKLLLYVDLCLLYYFLFLNNWVNDLLFPLEVSEDFPENSSKMS